MVLLLPLSIKALATTTTDGRGCSDDTTCIVGKEAQLSSAKWKCIGNILESVFEN
jgi:hypothetical protein